MLGISNLKTNDDLLEKWNQWRAWNSAPHWDFLSLTQCTSFARVIFSLVQSIFFFFFRPSNFEVNTFTTAADAHWVLCLECQGSRLFYCSACGQRSWHSLDANFRYKVEVVHLHDCNCFHCWLYFFINLCNIDWTLNYFRCCVMTFNRLFMLQKPSSCLNENSFAKNNGPTFLHSDIQE